MKAHITPFFLLLLVCSSAAWAQQAPAPAPGEQAAPAPAVSGASAPLYTYGTLRLGGGPLAKKGYYVYFDWGQEEQYDRLKDPQTQEPMLFNSVLDAVNYLARQGWELMQVLEEKRHDRTLWVLRKAISHDIGSAVK